MYFLTRSTGNLNYFSKILAERNFWDGLGEVAYDRDKQN
jgi:hypothetical protein